MLHEGFLSAQFSGVLTCGRLLLLLVLIVGWVFHSNRHTAGAVEVRGVLALSLLPLRCKSRLALHFLLGGGRIVIFDALLTVSPEPGLQALYLIVKRARVKIVLFALLSLLASQLVLHIW